MRKTVVEHFDQIPPCIMRLCARTRMRAKLLREIAQESGLPLHVVKRIARQSSWSNVKIQHAQLFSQACGVDLLRPRMKLFYLKRLLRTRGTEGLQTLARGLTEAYVKKQIALAAQGAKQKGEP